MTTTLLNRRTDAGTTGTTDAMQCDAATRATRSLLGYGIVAGPLYIGVWLIEAFARDGFDLRRHLASALSNGPYGWVHALNLVIAGAMVIAAAVGVRRVLDAGIGHRWAAPLLSIYGAGLVGAGVFRADPADGFPPGTPSGPAAHVTWHGDLHLILGAVGFLALIACAFVLARRFRDLGQRALARVSLTTAVVFLCTNATGPALADHRVALNLTLTAGVVVAWAWFTAMSLEFYRHASHRPRAGSDGACR